MLNFNCACLRYFLCLARLQIQTRFNIRHVEFYRFMGWVSCVSFLWFYAIILMHVNLYTFFLLFIFSFSWLLVEILTNLLQVPERVRAMNATIKLLLIVREPVTRAISDYTQLRSHAATATLPQQPPISQQQQSSVPMSVTSAASSSTPSLSAASK